MKWSQHLDAGASEQEVPLLRGVRTSEHTRFKGVDIQGHTAFNFNTWQSLKHHLFAPPMFCFLILYFISKRSLKCMFLVFFSLQIPERSFTLQ